MDGRAQRVCRSKWLTIDRYLILAAGYSSDPQLRFSEAGLYVFVAALLTGGYSLSILLWFVCPNLVFQTESVFL